MYPDVASDPTIQGLSLSHRTTPTSEAISGRLSPVLLTIRFMCQVPMTPTSGSIDVLAGTTQRTRRNLLVLLSYCLPASCCITELENHISSHVSGFVLATGKPT